MTSNRPYLIRALYEWILDNAMTPHILVNARVEGVDVPPQHVHDGRMRRAAVGLNHYAHVRIGRHGGGHRATPARRATHTSDSTNGVNSLTVTGASHFAMAPCMSPR